MATAPETDICIIEDGTLRVPFQEACPSSFHALSVTERQNIELLLFHAQMSGQALTVRTNELCHREAKTVAIGSVPELNTILENSTYERQNMILSRLRERAQLLLGAFNGGGSGGNATR